MSIYTGPLGVKGDKGDRGIMGPVGPKGFGGPKGKIGPNYSFASQNDKCQTIQQINSS